MKAHERLRKWRESNQYSLADAVYVLAHEYGIHCSSQSFHNWERGDNKPNLRTKRLLENVTKIKAEKW